MTLQYRIRSKYEDERWRHRVFLCENFLLETIDYWCRTDAAFPTNAVVAGILYLFSPRCDPFQLSPQRLRERLGELAGVPEKEYRLTWRQREASQAEALIASLGAIIAEAVESWIEHGIAEPSSSSIAQRIAEEIVAQQYVVFHHYQATRRDINPWGI